MQGNTLGILEGAFFRVAIEAVVQDGFGCKNHGRGFFDVRRWDSVSL
jgi:hypothetical protein